MKHTAPERIWLVRFLDKDQQLSMCWYKNPTAERAEILGGDFIPLRPHKEIEYVRADLHAALVAENATLREAVVGARNWIATTVDFDDVTMDGKDGKAILAQLAAALGEGVTK